MFPQPHQEEPTRMVISDSLFGQPTGKDGVDMETQQNLNENRLDLSYDKPNKPKPSKTKKSGGKASKKPRKTKKAAKYNGNSSMSTTSLCTDSRSSFGQDLGQSSTRNEIVPAEGYSHIEMAPGCSHCSQEPQTDPGYANHMMHRLNSMRQNWGNFMPQWNGFTGGPLPEQQSFYGNIGAPSASAWCSPPLALQHRLPLQHPMTPPFFTATVPQPYFQPYAAANAFQGMNTFGNGYMPNCPPVGYGGGVLPSWTQGNNLNFPYTAQSPYPSRLAVEGPPSHRCVCRKQEQPTTVTSVSASSSLKISNKRCRSAETQETDSQADDKKSRKRNKKKRDGDQPRIKRPMNAYMLFANEQREIMRQTHPEMKLTSISKVLGARWKEMTEDDKRPYRTQQAGLSVKPAQQNPDLNKSGFDPPANDDLSQSAAPTPNPANDDQSRPAAPTPGPADAGEPAAADETTTSSNNEAEPTPGSSSDGGSNYNPRDSEYFKRLGLNKQ